MTQGTPSEEKAVAELIDAFFAAMDAGDLEAFSRLNARDPDVVHVGTHQGERWVGWEALRDDTEEQFARQDAFRVSHRDREVKLLGDGHVACFFQEMDLETDGADGPARLEDARLTGVAEKRDGRWVLAQTHLSLPAQ